LSYRAWFGSDFWLWARRQDCRIEQKLEQTIPLAGWGGPSLNQMPTATPSRPVDLSQQNPPGAGAVSPEKPKANPRRKLLLAAAGALILAGALWFGIPWVQTTLNTVSTDDA
jgi:hypothetical protein